MEKIKVIKLLGLALFFGCSLSSVAETMTFYDAVQYAYKEIREIKRRKTIH